MNIKKYLLLSVCVASVFAVTSCDEFDPVFTGKYSEPESYEPVTMTPTYTIAEFATLYNTGNPREITENVIIGGKVSTSDQAGNFYRSFYIQDETGGIEIKVGKTGLYNDYKPGQTVYVNCTGLWIGMYGYSSNQTYGGNGMVQIGCEDPTGEYETSYIEVQYLIDAHVFRGAMGDEVEPVVVVDEKDLPTKNDTQATNEYVGRLVTLQNLSYANEIFTLLYINSNVDGKLSSNRVFLSDATHNVTTWAMSEQKVIEHLNAGDWDNLKVGNSNDQIYGTVADHKDEMLRYATPASVSQYFKMPQGTEIQIRTSGYCRFADLEIDPAVLRGEKTIDVTGILTMYQGSLQFVLLDQNGIKVND